MPALGRITDTPDTGQRGLAALEAALLLPLLAMILVLLVDGGAALQTWSSLSEASRIAARMAVETGDPASAATLVPSLLPKLDPESLDTDVTVDTAQSIVTVEVRYDYPSMFAALATFGDGWNDTVSLAASSCMPLP